MLSAQAAHKLLFGPLGILVNASNKVLFAGDLLSQNPNMEKYWGITVAEIGNFDTCVTWPHTCTRPHGACAHTCCVRRSPRGGRGRGRGVGGVQVLVWPLHALRAAVPGQGQS